MKIIKLTNEESGFLLIELNAIKNKLIDISKKNNHPPEIFVRHEWKCLNDIIEKIK